MLWYNIRITLYELLKINIIYNEIIIKYHSMSFIYEIIFVYYNTYSPMLVT